MRIALSGCFDLFHDGHKALLDYAIDRVLFTPKAEKLIRVYINSDESIKKLKGLDRPIEDIEIRVPKVNGYLFEKLHTYDKVDYEIIIFDTEKDLLKYYKEFKPDMIIHGSDIKDLNKVTGYGLYPYVFLPRINKRGKDISTTEIINEQALHSFKHE